MGKDTSRKKSRYKQNKKKRDELKVRTTISERKRLGLEEGEYEALVAGPIRRYIAYVIDILLYLLFWFFCLLAASAITNNSLVIEAMLPISVLIFGIIYAIPKITIEGKTLGRNKVKIEVIKKDGSGYLSWQRASIRWTLEIGLAFVVLPLISLYFKTLTFTITLSGFIVLAIVALPIFFTQYRQGIHDIFADSVVVRIFPDRKRNIKK